MKEQSIVWNGICIIAGCAAITSFFFGKIGDYEKVWISLGVGVGCMIFLGTVTYVIESLFEKSYGERPHKNTTNRIIKKLFK